MKRNLLILAMIILACALCACAPKDGEQATQTPELANNAQPTQSPEAIQTAPPIIGADAPNIANAFGGMWLQCPPCFGLDRAYAQDQQGNLWRWAYDLSQIELVTTLAIPPRGNYSDASGDARALFEQAVTQMAEANGALYAFNQYTGGIGIISESGVNWQKARFDADHLQTPNGENRMITGVFIKGGALYALADYYDQDYSREYNNHVVKIELETGKTSRFKTPDAYAMCAYGREILLLCADSSQICWLKALDPDTGDTRAVNIEPPSGLACAPAYSAEADTIYVSVGNSVYISKSGGAFELAGALPFPAYYVYESTRAHALPDGRYVCSGEDGLYAIKLTGAPKDARTLNISAYGGLRIGLESEFYSAYPNITLNVKIREQSAADIAISIQSGDTQTDIFSLRVDGAFESLKQKGYAAPIEDGGIISDSARRMYPELRAALSNADGELVAYPEVLTSSGEWRVKTDLWQKHFGGEALPATWTELFDAMLRFENMADTDGDVFMTVWKHENMLNALINAYVVRAEAAGIALDFTDKAFKTALEALDRVNARMLDKGIKYLSESELYPYGETGGGRSIFSMSGTGYASFLATLTAPSGSQLYFTFEIGERAVSYADMYVYILNPKSQNKDAALLFLGQAASLDKTSVLNALVHSDAEPFARGERVIISPEGLASWRETVKRVHFFENSAFVSDDMREQTHKLAARYAAGEMPLDSFTQKLNEVAQMIYWELN